jgi:hypothetical protein
MSGGSLPPEDGSRLCVPKRRDKSAYTLQKAVLRHCSDIKSRMVRVFVVTWLNAFVCAKFQVLAANDMRTALFWGVTQRVVVIFNVYGSVHRKYIPVYIQQDATLHSLFISGNCSTCLGWYLHPSSGAHTTVFTASGICQTVTATCHCSINLYA